MNKPIIYKPATQTQAQINAIIKRHQMIQAIINNVKKKIIIPKKQVGKGKKMKKCTCRQKGRGLGDLTSHHRMVGSQLFTML